MFEKAIYLFVSVCIIQEIHGRPQQNPPPPSSLQEAIERINPELDKISLRLKELKFEINKSLLQSFTESHASIATFGRNVLEAVNQLQVNANQMINIANKTNISIEQCLTNQQTNLERIITVASIKRKQISEEIQLQGNNFTEKADTLVKEADNIDKNINKIIGYCIRQNSLAWKQEELMGCLYNEASYVNRKVDQLYDEKDLINNDKKVFTGTVAEKQDSLLKWISKLQGEFIKCVSESEIKELEEPQDSGKTNNTDTKVSSKPNDKETPDQDSSGIQIFAIDEKQQAGATEYPFIQPQKIFERIRRLEVLLDRLKQLHHIEDEEKTVTVKSISEGNEFRLSNSLSIKSAGKNLTQPTEEDQRFILYISL